MISVTALTSGRNVPSSRFRVRQFIRPLADHGVSVTEHWPIVNKYLPSPRWMRALSNPIKAALRVPGLRAARAGDVVWLEREFVPGERTSELRAGRVRVFDVDDAIWLTGRPGFSEEIAAGSYGVIAGNDFIADHYRPFAHRVWVIPTSVDTDTWRPVSRRTTGRWTVGWIGTSSNLEYLAALDEPLAEFLSGYRQAELLVVCDRRPRFRTIPPARWRFVRWSPAVEREAVQQMQVGLMPLPDTDWARGKCGFKLLLYMAAGLPVVASPVGVNDVLLRSAAVGRAAADAAGWHRALCELIEDSSFAAAAGRAGRRLVEDEYSVRGNAVRLASIFEDAVRHGRRRQHSTVVI
jgi:glycosyltransferase involved in cell wall biosynthesis